GMLCLWYCGMSSSIFLGSSIRASSLRFLAFVSQGEPGAKGQQNFGLDFVHIRHGGKRRAASQFPSEVAKLSASADGIDFHAPIGGVLGVTCNAILLGRVHRKITIPDALHSARNEESLGLFFHPHCRLPAPSQPQQVILPERI